MVNELPLCQELAGVQDEHLQQFVLIRHEFDVAIPDLNDVAVQVNCEIACYENRPMLERFSTVAPRGRARATVRAGARRRDIERFLPASSFNIA